MQTTQTVPAERGPYLREIRVAAGITLRGLGEAAGVHYSHLSRFETGQSGMSEGNYDSLMRALVDLMNVRRAA